MKKAFDQTVRDLKRGVNKKVLKVPGIEQKVLDATSNEPWGPHGSHLADIAQATRNYHEYQMIMAVLWKRINDTGKNWRHVYKALTVLDYLVAHGSERVIDEIREHAYQISTLSDFQYIDSNGRDQGSNVRKKSQSLVALVNDKERIQEVRQKAAANRDKFRNTSSTGGMYKPGGRGGYGDQYDDDRYGSRDDDRNGYGREREGYREDDRYGRYGDSNSRDGDRYSRDSEERYGRDGYKDDDYRGRSRSVDYQYGSRSRSSDRERERAYEDDGQYSSRESGAKADDQSQDGSSAGRQLDRKFSEQNLGGPPSYEEAVGDAHDEKDGETSAASVPKESSPTVSNSPNQATTIPVVSGASTPVPAPANKEVDGFDEFDPRGSFPGAPTSSNGAEMDLLGSLSESFSSNSLALVPTTSGATTSDVDASANFGSGPTFEATPSVTSQAFEDPFGDGPFRAIPSADSVPPQPHNFGVINQSSNQPQPATQREEKVNNFDFGDAYVQVPSTVPQFSQESFSPHENTDILADILPPSGPSPPVATQAGQHGSQTGFPGQTIQTPSQTGFPGQTLQPGSQTGFPGQTVQPTSQTGFLAQTGQPASQAGYPPNTGQPAFSGSFPPQMGQPASLQGFPSQMGPTSQTGFPAPNGPPAPPSSNYYGLTAPDVSSFTAPVGSQAFQAPTGPVSRQNSDFMGNLLPQPQYTTPISSQPALTSSTGQLAIVPQQGKDKFETKSTVWADTLSRGLVNLNISGSKTNPLADIGVDFEAINRREKRLEKPSQAPVTSTVTMGKAMGSGSGIGRAGATALRPSPNAMVGSGMGMGMGGRPVAGMGVGAYGGMNQPMGMGMGMGMGAGMGMNMPANMGMGMSMNMGMGQGVQMPGPNGFPPGSTMPGGYNPMTGGPGGYAPQQPYRGGYR